MKNFLMHAICIAFAVFGVMFAQAATPKTVLIDGYQYENDSTVIAENLSSMVSPTECWANAVDGGSAATFTITPPNGTKIVSWRWKYNTASGSWSTFTAATAPSNVKVTGNQIAWSYENSTYVLLEFILNYTTYKIEYALAGGNWPTGAVHPTTAVYTNKVVVTNPERNGYGFTGWKPSNSTKVISAGTRTTTLTKLSTNENETVKVTAQWAANAYALTLDRQGGSGGSPSVTATYDADLPEITPPTRAGWVFSGYFTMPQGEDGGTMYYNADGTGAKAWTETGVTTLYAHWTGASYTVTVDPNGGTGGSCPSYTVSASEQQKIITLPTRTGYTISSWTVTGATGTSPTASGTTLTIPAGAYGNLTLKPTWKAVSYTITYNGLKEGSTHTNPGTYTIPANDIVFTPATDASGYKFNGWTPASVQAGSTGNKTVTAAYLMMVDKPIIVPQLPYNGSLQGCTTTGSGILASGNRQINPGSYKATFTPVAGYCWSDDGTTTEYVADWKIVNAEIENVNAYQTASLTYTGEAQQPSVYNRADTKGSQTANWKYSKSAGSYTSTIPSFTDAGTYTVYYEVTAQYHNPRTGSFTVTIGPAKSAKVTLSSDQFGYTGAALGPDVTCVNCAETSASVKRATAVGTYSVKAKPGANYAWSDGTSGERDFDWQITEGHYTATVSAGVGGSGSSTYPYETSKDSQAIAVRLPTRTGYLLTGWTASDYGGNPPTIGGTTLTIPAKTVGNFTMTPTWEPIRYTVDFDGNGGSGEMASTQLVYDVAYVVPECDFVLEGLSFQGWSVLLGDKVVTNFEAGVTVSNLTTVADTNLTFRAEWQTNSYTVVFLPNGAKGKMQPQEFRYGEVKPLSKCEFFRGDEEFWSFEGWTNSAAGGPLYGPGASVSNLTRQVDGRVELTAVWHSKLTDLSLAMGCENLMWEDDGSGKWTVCDTDGLEGVPPCVEGVPGGLTGEGVMGAAIATNGTLKFSYRFENAGDDPMTSWLTVLLVYGRGGEETLFETSDLPADWTSSGERDVKLPENFSEATLRFQYYGSGAVRIDGMTWTPDPGEGYYIIRFSGPAEMPMPEAMECERGTVYNLPPLEDGYRWAWKGNNRLYDGGVIVFDLGNAEIITMEAVQSSK